MAELKTKRTTGNVGDFITKTVDGEKREDSFKILEMMKKITKSEPKMWGSSIVGFKDVVLTYPSGRTLDWFTIGFSPRKQNLTLYVGAQSEDLKDLLPKLGKHTTGKGCLYVKKLADVDMKVLEEIIRTAAARK